MSRHICVCVRIHFAHAERNCGEPSKYKYMRTQNERVFCLPGAPITQVASPCTISFILNALGLHRRPCRRCRRRRRRQRHSTARASQHDTSGNNFT